MKLSNAFLTICLTLPQFLNSVAADHPEHHGTKRYLVLDNRIIEHTQHAVLTVGTITKHPSNPLFIEDQPWEKRFDNLYGNVIYDRDQQIYKCWYSPFIV
ncbi:MAG: hypothetical protein GY748_26060, partial [Planctomycetaceae bacterium]|nr:hypothetical protein [Planctomycetaceae bacterium]